MVHGGKMKVLVTGGAGFIGSNTVDLLISEGYEVVVIDDLSTGKKEYINREAIFYRASILDELNDIIKKEEIDCVLHMGAQVQVRKSLEDPVFDSQVNILGSINLIENCLDVEKFVYASSGGAIYGEPEYLPVDEEHPVKPLSPYGVSKFAVENYLHSFSKTYGLKYVSLRYGNVYGPRQDPYGEAGVVAIFAKRMLDGNRPKINGDGNQTRDFVYVKDVAKANLMAIEKKVSSQAFNIGTGRETSVNEIFNTIRSILGKNITPIYGPPIKGEVYRICLDIKKAKKKLGWRPEIGLENGIRELLEYLTS
jgi:UDP-glucose 4-epimerase